jgi:Tfp pilus assembly protein PilF
VFSAVERAQLTAPAGGAAVAPPPARPAVPPPPAIAPRAPTKTDPALQTSSIAHSNAGTKAYGQKQLATAIAEYERAVTDWPDNHIAFYGLAGTHVLDRNWRAARTAIAKAIALLPDEPMYYLIEGYVLYEGALQAARETAAAAEQRPVDQVRIDAGSVAQDEALASLAQAVRLNPAIWRAHYYLGRIYRDRGDGRWAAEELDAALRSGPTDPGPWIALANHYRRWGYLPAALAVGQQGLALVPDAGDLWFVHGTVQADLRKDREAVESFTRALDLRPDLPAVRFQRGQVYFRLRDTALARADLLAYLASTGTVSEERQAAKKMLLELGEKK